MKFVTLFTLVFLLPLLSHADDFKDVLISSTRVPLGKSHHHQGLDLATYASERNMGFQALSHDFRGLPTITSGLPYVQFTDDLILAHQEGLFDGTTSKRYTFLKKALDLFFKSNTLNHQTCVFKIYSASHEITPQDFDTFERFASEDPGTRLIVKSENVEQPSWKLLCQKEDGGFYLAKTGTYFFIFMDIYEPKDLKRSSVDGFYLKYLLSLH